ncbi:MULTISPECIES: acyl-CoA thioesterase [Mycobacteriaceae]|uniref:Acyl-CoA thioesterase n=1 Tax=Mycolicibacterium parafortuitum TaxID=39692 RepID=A0ACC6MBM7_MYCPF|nr:MULTISPECIES: thioesterase family protein [Mycobacteriaceae]MDZ5084289.1 acyl-CoA thioesterase [Mycolicibacterium parafortuitum]GFM17737.1 thioesterase superfamily protein [Mycobacterium sp. PO1]GFM24303.1 thioesterase superfamily protein [Mycobacterium sp. PO2]
MSADPVAGNYRYFLPITTRWMDNDVYGHVNNVTYYSYFDTVANHFLITEGGLDIHHSPVIALVVESQCSYRAPVAYPDRLRAGLRVDKLGNRSVTYGVAIFTDTDTEAVAHGQFVHVFVDRHSRRAVPIPQPIRTALETLIQS